MTSVQNSTDSALRSLLAAIDAEIAEELRKEQNQIPDAAAVQTMEELGRHICFRLADWHLAVPLALVVEVGELETVQPLPFLPNWAEGVTNIRGEIVSVTNLAVFFKFAARTPKKNRAVIIIQDNGVKTAVMVDRITGTRLLHRKEDAETSTLSCGSNTALADFLCGSALFFSGEDKQEFDLFDGRKLLAALRLQ